MKKWLNEIKSNPVFYTIVLGALVFSMFNNTFFLDGSNIHREFSAHDEYLTVREVYAILNPLSWKHFIMAVISGSMLYYGRIMYNIDAVVAWIPFLIWGIKGMVYSIRMVHVIFALAGLILLAKTFIKNKIGQILFLSISLLFYFTLYFFTVPKPEPTQLFFLAWFLFLFKKSEYKYGIHFILLGISYGIKFNVLTLLPFLFILPIWHHGIDIKSALKSVAWFVTGIFVAIPCLILSPIKPKFFETYIADTFGSAKHYDDVASVGFTDWFHPIWTEYYNGGIGFALLFILLLVLVLFHSKEFIKKSLANNDTLVPIFIGLFLILPVFITTKRLWPHYLWTGQLFLLLGVCAWNPARKRFYFFQTATLAFLLLGVFMADYKFTKGLFSRESEKRDEKKWALNSIDYIYAKMGKATILSDVSVYYPFAEFLKTRRFHPFAGPYPVELPLKAMYWRSPVSLNHIAEIDADYLLLKTEDLRTNLSETESTSHGVENIAAQKELRTELGKSILFDTSIGPFKIYKIRK